MSDRARESADLVRMRGAILKRAIDRGDLDALLSRARGDMVNVEAELATMPPEDVAAIRTGAAPLLLPEDSALVSCLSSCRRKWEREKKEAGASARADTHHEQIPLKEHGQAAGIDAALVPLVSELWKAKLRTVWSCQAHATTSKIWIQFRTAGDAERFLAIVAPYEPGPDSIYQRVQPWYFGMYASSSASRNFAIPLDERERTGWEFHLTVHDAYAAEREEEGGGDSVDIGLQVSVLFPEYDLPTVLQRMREHNEASEKTEAPMP